jgi:hypothetical protein
MCGKITRIDIIEILKIKISSKGFGSTGTVDNPIRAKNEIEITNEKIEMAKNGMSVVKLFLTNRFI